MVSLHDEAMRTVRQMRATKDASVALGLLIEYEIKAGIARAVAQERAACANLARKIAELSTPDSASGYYLGWKIADQVMARGGPVIDVDEPEPTRDEIQAWMVRERARVIGQKWKLWREARPDEHDFWAAVYRGFEEMVLVEGRAR